jgi:uncharacterized membrane protein
MLRDGSGCDPCAANAAECWCGRRHVPLILAFAALVIEVGHAYQVRRHRQASDDAAALAGAP